MVPAGGASALLENSEDVLAASRRIAHIIGLAILFGPIVALLVVGASVALRDKRSAVGAIPLIAVSTVVWLIFVGLYPHTDPCGLGGRTGDCPTVYGYTAPMQDDESLAGYLFLIGAGFLLPAAVAGFRRVAPPVVVGASLAVGPALLMWPTAPRGDEDGLFVFFMVYIWIFGLAAMAVAGWAARIAERVVPSAMRGNRPSS